MPGALLAAAAPAEARAILSALGAAPDLADIQWQPHRLSPSISLIITGIGKVNAAGAIARFAVPDTSSIVSLGIAGALPGSGLAPPDALLATSSIYADEGLATPDGFLDCAAMGFPLIPGAPAHFPPDPGLFRLLEPLATRAGPIATISTCSGTDALADEVRKRTGALAECMEGAAIAHIARRLAIPFAEVRIISNTTGDRAHQQWNLSAALEALAALTGRLAQRLT